MYNVKHNLVIGFHGTDADTCNSLLTSPQKIKKSEEPYDWLGHGVYFWENNYERALKWAEDKKKRGKIKEAAVIGAVLQLGHCFDLLDSRFTDLLPTYYELMTQEAEQLGMVIPENKDISQDKNKDKLLRELDCSVIEHMHKVILEGNQSLEPAEKPFPVFDSARGVFIEGAPIYPGAMIYEKSHIQICIRNYNCILGFFLPRKEITFKG